MAEQTGTGHTEAAGGGAHLGPDAGHQDAVDAAQLDVDLEAEVGERLRRGLVHVLGLDALGGQSEHGVADPLHLGW